MIIRRLTEPPLRWRLTTAAALVYILDLSRLASLYSVTMGAIVLLLQRN